MSASRLKWSAICCLQVELFSLEIICLQTWSIVFTHILTTTRNSIPMDDSPRIFGRSHCSCYDLISTLLKGPICVHHRLINDLLYAKSVKHYIYISFPTFLITWSPYKGLWALAAYVDAFGCLRNRFSSTPSVSGYKIF